jgi:hypothetical protein
MILAEMACMAFLFIGLLIGAPFLTIPAHAGATPLPGHTSLIVLQLPSVLMKNHHFQTEHVYHLVEAPEICHVCSNYIIIHKPPSENNSYTRRLCAPIFSLILTHQCVLNRVLDVIPTGWQQALRIQGYVLFSIIINQNNNNIVY